MQVNRGAPKRFTITLTPSSENGIVPFTKSLAVHDRVVAARFEPKIVTHELGATGPARDVAELTTFAAETDGAAGMAAGNWTLEV